MNQFLMAALLSFLAFQVAWADSDGYFCVGDGYLAYELREWSAPEKEHVLKVIRVGGPEAFAELPSVALDDFQLHGMKCQPSRVVLWSWDKTYAIDLLNKKEARISGVESHANQSIPSDAAVSYSLTNAARSSTVLIPTKESEYSYSLEIVHTEKNETIPDVGGSVHHTAVSKLVQKNVSGKVVREKPIFNSTFEETID